MAIYNFTIRVTDSSGQTADLPGSIEVTEEEVVGGFIKAYVNGAWTEKPIKVWTDSGWQQKPLKRWNGSDWVLT